MANLLDPTTGTAQGFKATKGTTAAPFNVPMLWQASTLSYVTMQADAAGNLLTVGGGGGGGAVTIADGADVAQGTTTDAAWSSGAGTVISLLKKIASAGGSAVSIADGANVVEGAVADAAVVSDVSGTLSAKLRGLVKILADVWDSVNHRLKVDGSGVTQPVSNAGLTNIDVLLSSRTKPADQQHTIVDSGTLTAVTAITNALPAGANVIGHVIADTGSTTAVTGNVTVVQPTGTNLHAVVDSGTVTANQGGAPWSENLTQVGGTAITAKAVPTGGSGQAAIPTYTNAIQLLSYTFGARNIATGALTANTAKQVLSLEVAASNTKTVKIRRILVSGVNSALLAGTLEFQANRGSAASTGGSAVTAGVRVTGDATPQTVCKTLPTITAATVLDVLPFAANGAAAASAQPLTVIYDWQEAGETKPWTLKPGVIDSFVLSAISTAAQNWTLTFHITLTEE